MNRTMESSLGFAVLRPLAVSLATLAVAHTVSARDSKPNIVLVLADDLGYADIGAHGCRDIPTPNIDRLTAAGVRLTSGYAAHPFCSPMRASLMTGRYQHRFGYERNIAYDPQNRHMGLPVGETTIATRLKRAGYATGMVGKWHLGAARPFHPRRRGFDFFYGFLGGGHDYLSVDLLRPMGEGYFQPLERDGTPEDLTEYLTVALSDGAVRFIESSRDRPFFLYVAYNAPHTPMQAPREYLDRVAAREHGKRESSDTAGGAKEAAVRPSKRTTYAAMVNAMDDGIGKILDCLDRLELREKTLVVFLSDNGGPERANASDNGALRGQKGDVYEGGIRVPFVLSWPGVLPAGSEYGKPVISHDISCTALAVAGLDVAADERLDGVSLVPFLTGERAGSPHEALFWRKEGGEAWAVRSGPWKLLETRGSARPELYDLDRDIGETTNLADDRPGEVRRLEALYRDWNRHNRAPFFPSFRDYHRIMNAHYRSVAGGEERSGDNESSGRPR